MTSHSARTMREVSETVVIHFYISEMIFWCKSLGRIISKVENLYSVLQARNRSFVRRGFRRKVLFFLSSTKLSEVVQDIAFDALAPDCSIQVLPIFLKSCLQSLCVCNCRGIVFLTHPTVYPSHCLSKVCVPAKEELFFVGFLPSASQTHRVCGQRFAIWGVFLALVVWRLLSKLCNLQPSA